MSEPSVEARAEALTAFVTGAVRVQSVSSNYGPAAIRALVDELGLTWEMVATIRAASGCFDMPVPLLELDLEEVAHAIAVILTAAGKTR